jgi:glycerol-3-phosphate dehydrogenase (NAD(P)+)
MNKICIIGAGSWGTALALTAHRAGQQVTLLPRRPEQSDILNKTRENVKYLPGVPLPSDLVISSDLTLLTDADIVLQVTPAQTISETCITVKEYLPSNFGSFVPKALWVKEKSLFLVRSHQNLLTPRYPVWSFQI